MIDELLVAVEVHEDHLEVKSCGWTAVWPSDDAPARQPHDGSQRTRARHSVSQYGRRQSATGDFGVGRCADSIDCRSASAVLCVAARARSRPGIPSTAMNEARYRSAELDLWLSVGARPAERRVMLDRTGVTVRLQEIGEGPTVTFIHGASNGGTSWAPLAARLQDFHCVLLDRPGCGLSPRLAESLADMRRLSSFADALIVDVLDALDISDTHLVATSFGGYFALRGAAAHPERVNRLVLIGWSFGAPVASTPFVMRVAMQPLLGRLITRIPVNERMLPPRCSNRSACGGLSRPDDSVRPRIAWFQSLLPRHRHHAQRD